MGVTSVHSVAVLDESGFIFEIWLPADESSLCESTVQLNKCKVIESDERLLGLQENISRTNGEDTFIAMGVRDIV